MSSVELAPADGESGRFRLSGELTFATASAALDQAATLVGGGDGVRIDLGGVKRVDSAGLAVLVDWLAAAQAQGRSVRLESAPAQLLALARVSGVDRMLALAAADGADATANHPRGE